MKVEEREKAVMVFIFFKWLTNEYRRKRERETKFKRHPHLSKLELIVGHGPSSSSSLSSNQPKISNNNIVVDPSLIKKKLKQQVLLLYCLCVYVYGRTVYARDWIVEIAKQRKNVKRKARAHTQRQHVTRTQTYILVKLKIKREN